MCLALLPTITPKTITMKKEQFNHNIAKARRQAQAKREDKGVYDVFNDIFASWNELYSGYGQLKEKLNNK